MSLQSINFLHITVSEIYTLQTFSHLPPDCPNSLPAHPDTMGENNTRRAIKSCEVKNRKVSPWKQLLLNDAKNIITVARLRRIKWRVDTTFCAEEGMLQGQHTTSHPRYPLKDKYTKNLQNRL